MLLLRPGWARDAIAAFYDLRAAAVHAATRPELCSAGESGRAHVAALIWRACP
jgi:hypothetical protein